MAFEVHCGTIELGAADCRALLANWRDLCTRRGSALIAKALGQLDQLSPKQLARFGIGERAYAYGWINCPNPSPALVLSLHLAGALRPLGQIAPAEWQEWAASCGVAPVPGPFAGRSLARLIGGLTRCEGRSPPDAHLGRWVRVTRAGHFLAGARNPDLRRLAQGERRPDTQVWLFLNPLW